MPITEHPPKRNHSGWFIRQIKQGHILVFSVSAQDEAQHSYRDTDPPLAKAGPRMIDLSPNTAAEYALMMNALGAVINPDGSFKDPATGPAALFKVAIGLADQWSWAVEVPPSNLYALSAKTSYITLLGHADWNVALPAARADEAIDELIQLARDNPAEATKKLRALLGGRGTDERK